MGQCYYNNYIVGIIDPTLYRWSFPDCLVCCNSTGGSSNDIGRCDLTVYHHVFCMVSTTHVHITYIIYTIQASYSCKYTDTHNITVNKASTNQRWRCQTRVSRILHHSLFHHQMKSVKQRISQNHSNPVSDIAIVVRLKYYSCVCFIYIYMSH